MVDPRYLPDYAAYEALRENNVSALRLWLIDTAFRPTPTSRVIVGALTVTTLVGMYVVGKWAYDKVEAFL